MCEICNQQLKVMNPNTADRLELVKEINVCLKIIASGYDQIFTSLCILKPDDFGDGRLKDIAVEMINITTALSKFRDEIIQIYKEKHPVKAAGVE